MTEMHVTLYGDAAERFEEIQQELEAERGFTVSNAGALRQLMAESDRPGKQR